MRRRILNLGRMATIWAALLSIASLPWPDGARADADKGSPQPTDALEVNAGWLRDFEATVQNAFYYRVSYEGRPVRGQGSEFAAAPNPNTPATRTVDKAGDTGNFNLRLERGQVGTNSELYDVLGIRPLSLSLPALARLRGTAQATGQLDGRLFTLALGLEAPPVHPLHSLNEATPANITNWVIFGVQAQRRQLDSTTTTVKESGVATARAFVGRGFWWRHSQQLTGIKKDLIRDVLAEASDFTDAQGLHDAIRERIKQGTATDADRLIQLIAQEGEGLPVADRHRADLWEQRVVQAATWNQANTPPDQPTVALWLEGLVWREFGRDRATDAWLNTVVSTLRWWPDPRHPNMAWLSLCYVNGFDRATLASRRDQLMLTLGTTF